MTARVLVVGWDGADWAVVEHLIERGCLPNVGAFIAEGARADLRSTLPTNSWAAWSTFMTGMEPGRHGVYDFVERNPAQPGRRVPVSSFSIRASTLFQRLSDAGHEVRVGNVPVTFPPSRVRGRMISGVAIPPGHEFVYPPEWAATLERRAPFPVNGMEWTRFRTEPERLVAEAEGMVEQRTASFEVLLEGEWDVGVCVYVSPDRLQHPFGAYVLPDHPRHAEVVDSPLGEAIRDVYRSLDRQFGRLRSLAGNDAHVLLLSDHGFRPVTRAANLERILVRLGFTTPARAGQATRAVRRLPAVRRLAKTSVGRRIRGSARRPASVKWSRTSAYQSGSAGQLSINLKGREPHGVVDPRDHGRVCQEVREALLSYRDPETGTRPVEEVHFGRKLLGGPWAGLAPDLIVQPADLWTFAHTSALTEALEWPTGSHRMTGVLVAAGPGMLSGSMRERSIADIAPTILALFGLQTSDMDGAPIEQIIGRRQAEPAVRRDEGLTGSGDDGGAAPTSPVAPALSDEDQEAITQHLRDLGYLE